MDGTKNGPIRGAGEAREEDKIPMLDQSGGKVGRCNEVWPVNPEMRNT